MKLVLIVQFRPEKKLVDGIVIEGSSNLISSALTGRTY